MDSTDVNLPPTTANDVKSWKPAINWGQIVSVFDRPYAINISLMIIVVIAALFRFHGINWDEGRHLHPDERFLSTVTNDLQWPETWDTYFDPTTSTLSPYSLPNMGLYVYGTLPVYIVKYTAILLNQNNYDKITIIGRNLSGLFDIATLLFLFLIAKKLFGSKVGLLAALLMSISVLNIQLSHFYTVDTFANLFVVGTIYFILRAKETGRWLDHALIGLLFGLGLATKLNVIILLVPIVISAALSFYERMREQDLRAALEHTLVRLFTVFFIAALTFRIIQPIAFSGPTFWDWSLNPRWLTDVQEQQKILNGDSDLPWVQQWTNRSIAFPLYNILFWGMGLPLGLASLAGIALALYELIRYRKLEHLMLVAYVGITYLYHARMFVKFMRYFLPIYPFLILFAAYGIAWLWKFANEPDQSSTEDSISTTASSRWTQILRRFQPTRSLILTIFGIVTAGTLIYALAFSTIYSKMNSRLQASRWMFTNIPTGSTLANEHWDDWLPIGGLDGKTSYGDQGMFKSVEMANYEDDNPAKLDKMVTNLSQADYIILSSNRLYDSIPRLPVRYPMTSRYYKLLFSGQLGFERVAEFTSYPTFLGIQFPDQVAEESFSVYDHPRVQIFKKTSAFNADHVRQLLSQGIVWESVVHLTPLEASRKQATLNLSNAQEALYQKVAQWSSAEINTSSWGSHLPVVAWFLVFQIIGWLAVPVTSLTFKKYADRGYLFSKPIGILLVAWAAWLIASVKLAPFTWWTILSVMVFFAVASALLIPKTQWQDLLAYLQHDWRLLLVEEILFWAFFGLLLFIRFHNPDLWHPGMGGEKPMDVAYLTAIAHTPYFPSYDPWFAGGYINYYYFGFVLVAALIHLTGIVPTIAYNLAVPTFFAMTAMGAFAVAFNFVHHQQKNTEPDTKAWLGIPRAALLAGLAGALFVAVLGNLAQVQLFWDGIRNLSTLKPQDDPSFFLKLAQFSDGLNQLLHGKHLNFRTEWWYWNATRVIPPAQGEAGPINEMPFFTFLFGDLHAHMMALPYTLLALGLSLNLVINSNEDESATTRWWNNASEILTLTLLGLTTGALWPMNTWDFPTYTLLAAAALTCREYARRQRVDLPGIWSVIWRVGFIVVVGRVLFLPFHQNYASAYFGAELWKGSRTPLWAYLLIHGFFLFILTSYLVLELFKGQGHNPLVRSLRLNLRYWRKLGHLRSIFHHITNPAPSYRLSVEVSQLVLAGLIILLVINHLAGIILLLTFLTTLLLFSTRPNPTRQFMLCMIGLGLLFTLLVEYIVLKGDISRMNTVFKFYLQVWVLWGVASSVAVMQLATRIKLRLSQKRLPLPELEEGTAWTPKLAAQIEAYQRQNTSGWLSRWWWAFGLLLLSCFLYPLTAAPVRMRDRFPTSVSATLDGTTYMRTSTYMDDSRPVELKWDMLAFSWLKQNVHGIPTIVEANTPLYRWGSRVSIYTGLPTVIGWDWHQKQQRSVLPGDIIDHRIEDVRTIYNSTDLDQVKQLLSRYHVQYIYVGALEKMYYDPNGLNKFEQATPLWSLVYQNAQVKIYKVNSGS